VEFNGLSWGSNMIFGYLKIGDLATINFKRENDDFIES